MTTAAEVIFDPVTLAIAELAAVAKPKDPSAFVALLQRFTEAILREAFEHQDEIRLRLGMRANGARLTDQQLRDLEEAARIGDSILERGVTSRRAVLEDNDLTGAADAGSRADHQDGRAASEAPAAPSTTPLDSSRREAAPTPGPLLDGLSPQGQPATGAKRAPSVLSEEQREAPPVRPATAALHPAGGESATGGAASLPPLDELESTRDATGAGAGAEASQSTKNNRRMTAAQIATLRAAYDHALRENGGELPRGFIVQQARALGFTDQAVYDRVRSWRNEPSSTESPAKRLVVNALKVLAGDPPPPRPPPSVAKRADDTTELVHTETPQCWCRKKKPSSQNVWCKLRAWEKPATEHASLRTPEPRAERFKVRRVQGTYGGGE